MQLSEPQRRLRRHLERRMRHRTRICRRGHRPVLRPPRRPNPSLSVHRQVTDYRDWNDESYQALVSTGWI
jgi:hypothetical protein